MVCDDHGYLHHRKRNHAQVNNEKSKLQKKVNKAIIKKGFNLIVDNIAYGNY